MKQSLGKIENKLIGSNMINEVLRRDKKEEMCLIKKQLTIFQKVKSLDSGRLMVHKQKKKKIACI